MAITAVTVAKDRRVRGVSAKSIFESALNLISTSSTWVQGELLCLDTSTHLIRRVAATGDAATILGLARQSITSGVPVGPVTGIVDAVNPSVRDIGGPEYGIIGNMKLKVADVFNPGVPVYLADTLDTMTVSVTDPGDGLYIGVYQGAAVTAAAGSEGPVLLGERALAGTAGINY